MYPYRCSSRKLIWLLPALMEPACLCNPPLPPSNVTLPCTLSSPGEQHLTSCSGVARPNSRVPGRQLVARRGSLSPLQTPGSHSWAGIKRSHGQGRGLASQGHSRDQESNCRQSMDRLQLATRRQIGRVGRPRRQQPLVVSYCRHLCWHRCCQHGPALGAHRPAQAGHMQSGGSTRGTAKPATPPLRYVAVHSMTEGDWSCLCEGWCWWVTVGGVGGWLVAVSSRCPCPQSAALTCSLISADLPACCIYFFHPYGVVVLS